MVWWRGDRRSELGIKYLEIWNLNVIIKENTSQDLNFIGIGDFDVMAK